MCRMSRSHIKMINSIERSKGEEIKGGNNSIIRIRIVKWNSRIIMITITITTIIRD